MKVSQNYPDISDILQRKAEGRREIAARTFGEKIAMVEVMQKRIAPFKRLKERRENAKRTAPER
jgi:hypothetical protein